MNFLADSSIPLVADTSVIISLNASARAAEIIRALANPLVVTESAFLEIRRGESKGHDDARQLELLISAGIVRVVSFGAAGVTVYETLIEGAAAQTLDDGEAATIAYAHEVGGSPVIDERKARAICAARFSSIPVFSTAELLMHEAVRAALGVESQVEAIVSALRNGRMRVPADQVQKLVGIIGETNAASCSSLPKAARKAGNQ